LASFHSSQRQAWLTDTLHDGQVDDLGSPMVHVGLSRHTSHASVPAAASHWRWSNGEAYTSHAQSMAPADVITSDDDRLCATWDTAGGTLLAQQCDGVAEQSACERRVEQPLCDAGWYRSLSGECYKLGGDGGGEVTWRDAAAQCVGMGGRLATPELRSDVYALGALLPVPSGGAAWVGLYGVSRMQWGVSNLRWLGARNVGAAVSAPDTYAPDCDTGGRCDTGAQCGVVVGDSSYAAELLMSCSAGGVCSLLSGGSDCGVLRPYVCMRDESSAAAASACAGGSVLHDSTCYEVVGGDSKTWDDSALACSSSTSSDGSEGWGRLASFSSTSVYEFLSSPLMLGAASAAVTVHVGGYRNGDAFIGAGDWRWYGGSGGVSTEAVDWSG
ncbi:MAG: hypothetical protein GY739_18640, partial [Mesoflavibacter sp.]|nr:hypothetical protein [Mesoflavibacter sp.]